MNTEELQKLDSFNDTGHEYDRGATVADLFMKNAKLYPGNSAVIYNDKVYTYAQTERLSSAVAHYIVSLGLGKGDVVSVFIPRCEYMVIASLGVLRSGCAYEPLDPDYPDVRLSYMVNDAGSKLIIAADEFKDRLTGFGLSCPVLFLSQIPSLYVPDSIPEELSPKPDDLFTLIYTSGTTGLPKGVKVLHRNISAYCAWYRRYFEPAADWRVTCYNSYGFDGSLTDMYPVLTVGAAAVIVPEETRHDLHAVAALIDRHRISLTDLPCQVARQFAASMKCPTLKYIVAGGEKLLPIRTAYPYIIANQYGPTETTVAVTCYNTDGSEEEIPIGKPADNTAIYIVDIKGERVPVGEEGELWVAGEQVTGGYLGRPEETAEAFVPNPFSDDPAYGTVYKTGDIVRYRPDGNIEYVGRRDGLVKIRGFRIELGEVEKAILEYPGVKRAAVTDFDHPSGGKFIAAYVVHDSNIDIKALEDFLRRSKPSYMVPTVIMQIDEIPLNQNGKLDKKALPVPELRSEEKYTEPVGDTEIKIAHGFAAVLGLERAGAELDFFAAGGDSLRVMQLIGECEGLGLSFRTIYEGKTPRGIAALVGESGDDAWVQKKETHFLGPLHETHYMWGNVIEEGYGLHCDATIHLGCETDPERLASAVETVLLAHPSVDARLTEVNGKLRWKQGDMKNVRPFIEKVTRGEYDELRKTIRRYMNKPETRMFNTRIFEITEPDGSISRDFYFDFLHPIADGSSIEIFLDEINTVYSGGTTEPEPFSIFDYYDRIEEEIGSEKYEKEREWNSKFVRSFTDKLSCLTGDLVCGEDENDTKDIFVPLKVDLAAVDRFTEETKVSIASLLAAAYGFVVGNCNGEKAAVGLSIYSARDDERYARTFGAVYRHYPLCVKWTDDMSSADFVRNTQENIMLCRLHALYEADPVPIDAGFVYQGEDLDDLFDFCGGKALYDEIEDYEEEGFDFFIHRRRDDLYCNLTYNSLRYSDKFVADFLSDYADVIHALVSGTSPSGIYIATPQNIGVKKN